MTGQSSTSSTNSSADSSDEDDSDSEEDDKLNISTPVTAKVEEEAEFKVSDIFPTTKEVYGFELKAPSKADSEMYKKYVQMDRALNPTNLRKPVKGSLDLFVATRKARYEADIPIPTVSPESIKIYRDYVNSIERIRDSQFEDKNDIIKKYVNFVK
jgi:hypothetical protein